MSALKNCRNCGKQITSDVPQGLCPACLMKIGMGTGTGAERFEDASGAGPATAFVPPSLEQLQRLIPQFEVLGMIGRGGMGAVYMARQKSLDRLVALKFLAKRADKDPKFNERFALEARTLARLSHPNIISVFDFGEADGICYLVMEYVDGVNLRQMLRTRKLAPKEALAIVPDLCAALQYAHDRGIVHRDIKPENILIDRQGRIKIADFGIAKLMGTDALTPSLSHPMGEGTQPHAAITDATKIMGTPKYMAPEQTEHPQAVDHRADIFSLGVVFYEMLTGELPGKPIEPPSRKVQVDVRLDEVVLRALEQEPRRRYQQVSQVKTDVETIAAAAAQGAASSFATAQQSSLQLGAWSWLEMAQWSARLLGLSLLLFFAVIFGLFLFGAGLPPLARQSGGTLLNYLAIVLMVLGFILGWKLEGAAAVLIATGWALWHSSNGTLEWSMFHIALLVAALYTLRWWATQGRRTAVLVTAMSILIALLVFGIRFLPTNIQLYGAVLDAVTGRPIPNAELTISYQPVSSKNPLFSWLTKLLWELTVSREVFSANGPEFPERERSSPTGWFALRVGWHAPGKQVRITAPGYATLQVELGPKPRWTRRMHREFALSPTPMAPQIDITSNPPTRVVPTPVATPNADKRQSPE